MRDRSYQPVTTTYCVDLCFIRRCDLCFGIYTVNCLEADRVHYSICLSTWMPGTTSIFVVKKFTGWVKVITTKVASIHSSLMLFKLYWPSTFWFVIFNLDIETRHQQSNKKLKGQLADDVKKIKLKEKVGYKSTLSDWAGELNVLINNSMGFVTFLKLIIMWNKSIKEWKRSEQAPVEWFVIMRVLDAVCWMLRNFKCLDTFKRNLLTGYLVLELIINPH